MLSLLQNIFSFIVLILLQVLVLNNVQFLGFLNPYIYILFILSLPVKFPRWITLILGFVLGLIIDVFSNTIGTHAFATVLIAFFRTGIIKLFTSRRRQQSYTFVPFIRSWRLYQVCCVYGYASPHKFISARGFFISTQLDDLNPNSIKLIRFYFAYFRNTLFQQKINYD